MCIYQQFKLYLDTQSDFIINQTLIVSKTINIYYGNFVEKIVFCNDFNF